MTKLNTLLSRADEELIASALAVCISLKMLIHREPELLENLLNYLYDSNQEEEVEVEPIIDAIFMEAEKKCLKLAQTYVLEHPLMNVEEDAPSSGLDEYEINGGTMVYRVYRDILFMYVGKLWGYINAKTVVVSTKTAEFDGVDVSTSLLRLDLDSLGELVL